MLSVLAALWALRAPPAVYGLHPANTPSAAASVLSSPSAPEHYDAGIVDYAFAGNGVWLVVDNTLLHTTDEGRRWTPQIPITSRREVALAFVDSNHGWIVSDGYIQATTDGGQHWVRRYPAPGYLGSLSFISIQQGWVVLDRKLLATHDGGQTWQLVASNYP